MATYSRYMYFYYFDTPDRKKIDINGMDFSFHAEFVHQYLSDFFAAL